MVAVRLPLAPRTRADCIGGPRPCPFTSCRHHIRLRVRTNSSRVPAASCALDFVDAHGGDGATLQEVADALGVSQQAARAIEVKALRKLVEE